MDAQPKPGEGDYLEHLGDLLSAAKVGLIQISELDGELVKTQVTRAVLSQRLWEISALIATENGKPDEARKCSKLALEFSTQQTRALKQQMADRLADLEAKLEKRGARVSKLRAV